MLLIAKLDRLGRSVAFISALMESRVDFKAMDVPIADPLILHIMAAFAQHERSLISARTKNALLVAKKRGVKLGEHGKNYLSKENKSRALFFARQMKPQLESLINNGFTSIRSITEQLNQMQIPTYRGNGHRWHIATVHGIMDKAFQ